MDRSDILIGYVPFSFVLNFFSAFNIGYGFTKKYRLISVTVMVTVTVSTSDIT